MMSDNYKQDPEQDVNVLTFFYDLVQFSKNESYNNFQTDTTALKWDH